MGVRAFAAAVAALLTILAASHPAGAQDDRLLFCGFEKEELSRHFQVHRNDGDKVHLILPNDGRWSAKTVAEEGPAIEAMAVPQRSPEHFVPVAWRSGLGMVKLLRVPVEDQPNGS
jgi:hypothetical protein